jgi:sugar (pentulose or hexulose) kinase
MNSRGEVQSNCFGWRDQRALEPHPSGSGSYYDVLKQRITPAQRSELGNELPPGAPVSFLFWLAEQNMLAPGLIPTSLADFVLTTLSGTHSGVDATNAMSYELLDLKRMCWHEKVIEQLGLAELQWPVLRQHGEVVGFLNIHGKQIPCYTPVGDYQCALAGALLAKEELSLNISTGSQVSRLTQSLNLGDYQTRPFFDGRFTNTVSHLPAGRSLDVLLRLVTELVPRTDGVVERAWDYVTRVAAAADHSDLEVNLSFFPGPCGNRGSISNIREKNLTVGTLFRASFENMAENYYQCALRIWPDQRWTELVFSGGLARKVTTLRTTIEHRFNAKSRLCPIEEDTLLGLLVLARAWSRRALLVEEAMKDLRHHYQTARIT